MAFNLPSTMRAWQYNKYGGGVDGLTLGERAVPQPKSGQLLFKTAAVSVNPFDWKIQNGILKAFMALDFPYVPCVDVAGEVVAVGEGVDSFAVGDKVIGYLQPKTGGGAAEYVLLKASECVKLPPNLSTAEASCLGVAGLTALQGLQSVGVKTWDGSFKGNVLVAGGSGGVGMFAVQLAKLAGAHVTATCGKRNFEFVKSLGADEVIDYSGVEGKACQSPSGKMYDVIIDATPHSVEWGILQKVMSATGGRAVTFTPSAMSMLQVLGNKATFWTKKKFSFFILVAQMKELTNLAQLVSEEKVRVHLSTVLFENFNDAWASSIEGHVTGKVVAVTS